MREENLARIARTTHARTMPRRARATRANARADDARREAKKVA